MGFTPPAAGSAPGAAAVPPEPPPPVAEGTAMGSGLLEAGAEAAAGLGGPVSRPPSKSKLRLPSSSMTAKANRYAVATYRAFRERERPYKRFRVDSRGDTGRRLCIVLVPEPGGRGTAQSPRSLYQSHSFV